MREEHLSSEESSSSFFSKAILAWYDRHKRDLPWRENKDPYRIWVSEIMLQQTRVDTVIPYYERFIAKYPTVDDLAKASEEEVIKLWEGLGYYSRVRNLHSAAKEVRELYGSEVPREPREIAKLKGVGPYTAGAILSIAFNKPEPAVDGNVLRVLSRYFCLTEDITKPAAKAHIEHLIRDMIPTTRAGDFNQALMELGALVCTPKSPQCIVCPAMQRCQGRIAGMEEQLPVKKKAKPPRIEHRAAVIIAADDEPERVLIRQRPDQGLLASMWELPHFELPELLDTSADYSAEGMSFEQDWLLEQLQQEQVIGSVPPQLVMQMDHVFSHIHWKLRVFELTIKRQEHILQPTYRWIREDDMDDYAFPNVFSRMLGVYLSSHKKNGK